MQSIRQAINERPWIGWTVAAVCATFATLFVTGVIGREPSPQEMLAQEVTIRCTETGEEWTMTRGEFERALYLAPGRLDPERGIPSPHADGRPTGVLVNKQDWEQTVARINAAKDAAN
ncbi:MAG: hypothetical protein AAGG07_13285 [Planctomycetota bacterium]